MRTHVIREWIATRRTGAAVSGPIVLKTRPAFLDLREPRLGQGNARREGWGSRQACGQKVGSEEVDRQEGRSQTADGQAGACEEGCGH
jgi:hypothetical protein